MSNFMVGNNFDIKLIEHLIQINAQQSRHRITEVYGSTTTIFPEYTARPLFRLPSCSMEDFVAIKKLLDSNNIIFNLTMNGPNIDKTKFNEYQFMSFLKQNSITRVTVASTFLLEILKGTGIEVELSTIYNLHSLRQAEMLFNRYPNIVKVCIAHEKHRDIEFIRAFTSEFPKITLELMVNEFCLNQCPNRAACYLNHQNVKSKEESLLFGNFPMADCIKARNESLAEWLMAPFILPEWLYYYETLGVHSFKITGRTANTNKIVDLLGYYLLGKKYSLADLWFHLENIHRNNDFSPERLKHIDYNMLKPLEALIFGSLFDADYNFRYYRKEVERIADDILRRIA